MAPLPDRVARFIERHRLVSRGDLVLAGVSGGADSIFMLTVLGRILPDLGAALHVVHLDHGLRGRESEDDASFVRDVAGRLALPCTVERRPAGPLPGSRLSPQESYRQVRLAFFEEVRARLGAVSVALGHTADDDAETLVMRLVGGGGPASLGGIRPRGPGSVIHPILAVSRMELTDFLKGEGIDWRTDSSNLAEDYLRNRVRARLMPEVLGLNPAFPRRAALLGRLLADDSEYLDREAGEAYEALVEHTPSGVGLALDGFLELPPPLRRRVARRAALEAGAREKDLAAVHVESLLELASGRTGSSWSLPGGCRAHKTAQRLRFTRSGEAPPLEDRAVALPGRTAIPELGLVVSASAVDPPPAEELPSDRRVAFLDADAVRGPLTVGSRRPGDRFVPLGLGHHRKLKNFLIDLKVPRPDRDAVPVFRDNEKIVWLGGLRLDDRVRLTPATASAWRLEITEG